MPGTRTLWIGGAIALAAGLAGSSLLSSQENGEAIFRGKGNCFTCHGAQGKGTALAPDLTDSVWLNIDGSQESIAKVIRSGVAQPKQHPAPMPPMGGARLKDAEIGALAGYVHALGKAAEKAGS